MNSTRHRHQRDLARLTSRKPHIINIIKNVTLQDFSVAFWNNYLKWAPRIPRKKHFFLDIYRISEIYFKISFAYQRPQLHFIHVRLRTHQCSLDCLITLRLHSTNILLTLVKELIYILFKFLECLVDAFFTFHVLIFTFYEFHLHYFRYFLLTLPLHFN